MPEYLFRNSQMNEYFSSTWFFVGIFFLIIVLTFIAIIFLFSYLYQSMLKAPDEYQIHRHHFNRLLKLRKLFEQYRAKFPDQSRPVLYKRLDEEVIGIIHSVFTDIKQGFELNDRIVILNQKISQCNSILLILQNLWQLWRSNREFQIILKEFKHLVRRIREAINQLKLFKDQMYQLEMEQRKKIEGLISEKGSLEKKLEQIDEYSGQEAAKSARFSLDMAHKALQKILELENAPEPMQGDGKIFGCMHVSGEFALKAFYHFNLLVRSLNLAGYQYELDETGMFLKEVAGKLQVILQRLDEINCQDGLEWQFLKDQLEQIELITPTLMAAENSLNNFKNQLSELEQLVSECLNLQRIDRLEELAVHVESKFEIYLGTYEDAPENWLGVLKVAELPRIAIERSRNFANEHLEEYVSGQIIRQSNLPNRLNHLRRLKGQLSNIDSTIEAIEKAYQEYVAAEKVVNEALKPGGSTQMQVMRIKKIAEDTSREISNDVSNMLGRFELFKDRALLRKSVNFPDMKNELSRFEWECKELVERHNKMLTDISADASTHFQSIKSIEKAFHKFEAYAPPIEVNWSAQQSVLQILKQKYQEAGDSYRQKYDFIAMAKKEQPELNEIVDSIQAQVTEFENQYQQTRQLLRAVHEALKKIRDRMRVWASNWSKFAEIEESIMEISDFLSRMEKINTSPSINQATALCKEYQSAARGILRDMEGKDEEYRAQSQKLEGLYRIIDDSLSGELSQTIGVGKYGNFRRQYQNCKTASSFESSFETLQMLKMEVSTYLGVKEANQEIKVEHPENLNPLI